MKLNGAFWIGLLPCLFVIVTGAASRNSLFHKTIPAPYDVTARKTCTGQFTSVRDHCYYFSPDVIKNWDEASRKCHTIDPKSHLVQIETEQEWKIIKTYLNEEDLGGNNYWIGASDRDDEGEWLWVGSDSPVEFTNWCKDKPTDSETFNCAIITKGDLVTNKKGLCWADYHCTKSLSDNKLHYICEQ